MNDNIKAEPLSQMAARALRGGLLPHIPPPASPVSTRVTLELEAPPNSDPEIVFTDPSREHGWRVVMTPTALPAVWRAQILLPHEPTLLLYHFELAGGSLIRERRQKEGVEKPLFGVWEEKEFQLAVYLPQGSPPAWVQGQVFYQIFPDRFARSTAFPTPRINHTYALEALHLDWDELPEHPPKSRDFYGGNLRGVIEKLDYLVELGVTCLYFTPIFISPTNHRYDAIDYALIDPQLGTLDDLQDLIEQASQRGMKVLLDGVFNHCSSDSVYFKAAQADRLSPYYRWFNFRRWPDEYEGWVGVRTMPEFVECPEVEEFFFGPNGIARYWLSFGIAGWRTDVTPWISDEYWRRFRKAVRQAYPDAYLVAEDWGDSSRRLLGDAFDATMNYRFAYSVVGFARGKLSPLELDDRLETLRRDTPPGQFNVQLNLLDSHDTPRAFTLLDRSPRKMMLAAAMQLAYPGAPMICYGDEAGMEGEYAENSRRPFPWAAPDQAMLDFYRRAIAIRRSTPALNFGDVETVWIDLAGGYAFARCYQDQVVVAAFNNTGVPLRAVISLRHILQGQPGSRWRDLLGSVQTLYSEDGVLQAVLPPYGAGWFMEDSP